MFLAPRGSFVMASRMGRPDRSLNYRCSPWFLAHALIRVWFADLLVYAPIVTVCSQSGSRFTNYLPDVDLLATWLLASARIREFALLFGMDHGFVYSGALS